MPILPFACLRIHQSGYERWHSYEGGREVYASVHRLLTVAEHAFEAAIDKHVHHKNGIQWANWRENVEPREPSERANYHPRGQAIGVFD